MSFLRYARRRDLTHNEVVKTLEQARIEVYEIERPVDLLCRFWCSRHQQHCWEPLEVKTLHVGRKSVQSDKRQVEQREFIEKTGTPQVTTGLEALLALSVKHAICSGVISDRTGNGASPPLAP